MKRFLIQPVATVQQGSKRLLSGVLADLVGVVGYVCVAVVVLTVLDVSSPTVRAAVGFPFLLFVPGYVIVSALFPHDTTSELVADEVGTIRRSWSLTDVERAALAFGLSVATLPLFGLAISVAPLEIEAGSVVGAIAAFATLGVLLAGWRRLALPDGERYRFSLGRRLERAYGAVVDAESPLHTLVNVVLVLSLVIAAATVGFALTAPHQTTEYTNFELLTETDDGDLVAGDYPEAVEPGDPISFVVGLENQEDRDATYTVVVQEQWIDDGDVLDRTELERTEYTVDAGGSAYGDHDVTPNAESGTVRISVLLYEGDAPESPTDESADAENYFWVDVEDGAAEDGTDDGETDGGDDGDDTDDEEDDDADDGFGFGDDDDDADDGFGFGDDDDDADDDDGGFGFGDDDDDDVIVIGDDE